LTNGENFIDYLEQFTELYQRLFKNDSDAEIPDEYYQFNKKIIKEVDGTAFLKELYEIAMLCYVNKFGLQYLLETSYWIFRYTYSLRLSSRKAVRESSIPAFLCKGNYIFDIILTSFTHEQVILLLRQFSYTVNSENIEENTVKARFIERVTDYFEIFETIEKNNYDVTLIASIERKIERKIKRDQNGNQ